MTQPKQQPQPRFSENTTDPSLVFTTDIASWRVHIWTNWLCVEVFMYNFILWIIFVFSAFIILHIILHFFKPSIFLFSFTEKEKYNFIYI